MSTILLYAVFVTISLVLYFLPDIIAVIVTISLVLYFLPAIIAERRNIDGFEWITFLNLVLGWTIIVWLILLFVAITASNKSPA